MIAHSVDDPFYYLYNFRQVVLWVEQRYQDLLDDQELAFIRAFSQLQAPAQALMVRMVMRKGELFRSDRLDYAEIGDTALALQPLQALGWVREPEQLELEQLFALLRKDELARCFARQLSRPRAAKHELLAQLKPLELRARPLAEWFPDSEVRILQWCLQPLCDRVRLLFFGNMYQDWSDFVLADLGLLRYEQVPFSSDSRALQRRDELDLAMALHQCAERLEQGGDPVSILATLQGLHSENPWLARRHARLQFALGQQCERQGDWDLAMAVYAQCDHAQARIRQVRVLERSEQWPQAHALALQLAAAPANALEVQALERMLPRLARKLGGPPQRRQRVAPLELIELELPREHAALGVEEAVRQHLALEGGRHIMWRTRCSTACLACCAGRPSSPRCPAHSSTRSRLRHRTCTTATSSNGAVHCSSAASGGSMTAAITRRFSTATRASRACSRRSCSGPCSAKTCCNRLWLACRPPN